MRGFLLESSFLYSSFQKLTGALQARIKAVERLGIRPGDRILDMGCGPADILEYLPKDVNYTGLDNNKNYIKSAKKHYKDRGYFFCDDINDDLLNDNIIEKNSFNIILAFGILHHLPDDQAVRLFELARTFLIKGGKLITFDGCFTREQTLMTKLILKLDRGNFVRTEEEYAELANYHFADVKTEIATKVLHIPYTLSLIHI